METPILTNKQKKASLSAKKTKKITIKNVLASPFQQYWPCVNEQHETKLIETLEANLPRTRKERVLVPYSSIKDVPREERGNFRKRYASQHLSNSNSNELFQKETRNLCFGINEVTKGLENNILSCVLISEDVNPRKMTQHVLDLSVLHRIPTLVCPNLRTILRDCCNLESMMFGIKNAPNLENNLTQIVDKVKTLYAYYPPPKNHILSFKNSQNWEKIGDKKINEKNKKCNSVSSKRVFYLTRTDPTRRTFVPPSSKQPVVQNIDLAVDSTGFIPFEPEEPAKRPEPVQDLRLYKALMVKRLKGNKNRQKNKVATSKSK